MIEGGPGSALCVRRGDKSQLHILATPFRSTRWEGRGIWFGIAEPVAILIVSDPDTERHAFKARLQEEFGLTVRETEAAIEICKGDGRDAAAGRLAINAGTPRIHLQRIFAKNGRSSPSRTRPASRQYP